MKTSLDSKSILTYHYALYRHTALPCDTSYPIISHLLCQRPYSDCRSRAGAFTVRMVLPTPPGMMPDADTEDMRDAGTEVMTMGNGYSGMEMTVVSLQSGNRRDN